MSGEGHEYCLICKAQEFEFYLLEYNEYNSTSFLIILGPQCTYHYQSEHNVTRDWGSLPEHFPGS